MAFLLKYGLCCIKHCWGVYEQNSIVNNVSVDDWTAELAIIASNEIGGCNLIRIQEFYTNFYLFFWLHSHLKHCSISFQRRQCNCNHPKCTKTYQIERFNAIVWRNEKVRVNFIDHVRKIQCHAKSSIWTWNKVTKSSNIVVSDFSVNKYACCTVQI